MITKTSKVDQITIGENGIINYRVATAITEDGIELAKSYWRNSLEPGKDLTGIPQEVVDVANLKWTPEVVAAFQALIASSIGA